MSEAGAGRKNCQIRINTNIRKRNQKKQKIPTLRFGKWYAEYASMDWFERVNAWGFFGIIGLILTICAYRAKFGPFLTVVILGMPTVALLGNAVGAWIIMQINGMIHYRWAVERIKKENAELENEIPRFEENLRELKRIQPLIQKKLRDAQAIRQQVYGVNIIPSRYRNIHVSYYLYDYFKTSRETDLDKVIQTLLLDEIVQRLDKIISQMEEIILNQRFQTALMEQQNEMIANNHREQMRCMARMERNQEIQNDYLNMIDQDINVSNFILSMEFLFRKH